MSKLLDNAYDSCIEAAPDAGQALGYFGGAVAAAPFAAATVGEAGAPPAWGAGQLATVAAAAAAFDFGKHLGTAVGTDLAEGACDLIHDAGQSAIAAYDWAGDHFAAPASDTQSHDSAGGTDPGHGGGGMDGGI